MMFRTGDFMELISINPREDKMLKATNYLNERLDEIYHRRANVCNRLMLLNYKESVLSLLPAEIVLRICKGVFPKYNPRGIMEYIRIKEERVVCFTTLVLCIKNRGYHKPPREILRLIFEYYKLAPPGRGLNSKAYIR